MLIFVVAPEAGLEPATNSLTGSCSTIELLRNIANIGIVI